MYTKGEKIIFSSRALNEETIDLLVKNNIHIIANSKQQLDLIYKKYPDYHVGVRVDTGIKSKNTTFCASNLGLGIPLDKLKDSITPNVVGIHNHLASQNVDIEAYRKNARELIKVSTDLKFRYLDIGGGFPIKYYNTEAPLLLEFSEAYRGWGNELFIEPGRFLVGPAGYLFVKVVDITQNNVVINTSLFSTVRDRILSIYAIQLPILESGKIDYKIVGSSSSSCDDFGEYKLTKLDIGSTLTFSQAGAYCVSNDDFTGTIKPKEYFYLNGTLKSC